MKMIDICEMVEAGTRALIKENGLEAGMLASYAICFALKKLA